MKLWLISQDENNGYDAFDSAVVAAADQEAARKTHPNGYAAWCEKAGCWKRKDGGGVITGTWVSHVDNVSAVLIGEAVLGAEAGVILASFNAG